MRNVILGVLVALLVVFFIYDFAQIEPSVAAETVIDHNSPPISGELLLQNVRYDGASRGRVLSDLVINVKSVKDIEFSGDAAFAIRRIVRDVPWLLTINQQCNEMRGGGSTDPHTWYTAEAQFECKDVELATDVASNELWYPFDHYSTDLYLIGCVNTTSPCDLKGGPTGLPIRFSQVRVEPGAPQFIATIDSLDDQAVEISLKRRLFLRAVSMILGVMVLIFVFFLSRSDPNDTMLKALSLFGGLWALRSLIVPSAVTAFPTLIDFSVLTVFCTAFLVVLARIAKL